MKDPLRVRGQRSRDLREKATAFKVRVDDLDELEGVETVALPSVLRRFQALNHQGLQSGDQHIDIDARGRGPEGPVFLNRANAEPGEPVSSAAQPISGVLPQTSAHAFLGHPAHIDRP